MSQRNDYEYDEDDFDGDFIPDYDEEEGDEGGYEVGLLGRVALFLFRPSMGSLIKRVGLMLLLATLIAFIGYSVFDGIPGRGWIWWAASIGFPVVAFLVAVVYLMIFIGREED